MSPLAFVSLNPAPISTKGVNNQHNRFNVSQSLLRRRDVKMLKKQVRYNTKENDTENFHPLLEKQLSLPLKRKHVSMASKKQLAKDLLY